MADTRTMSRRRQVFDAVYLFLGCVLLLVGVYGLFVRIRFVPYTSNDFMQDYEAARNLKSGRSIYHGQAETANYHPPTVAVLILPIANLPYPAAARWWSFFCLICLAATVWIVFRALEVSLPLRWSLIFLGGLLCWYPVQGHIAIGQFSILIALLLVLAWQNLRKGRQTLGGLFVGVACLLKLFPALLVVYFLFRRKWLALSTMVLAIGLGYSLALAVVGFEDTWHYFTVVIPQDVEVFAAFPVNLSLNGVFSRLFTSSPWIAPLADLPWLAAWLTNLLVVSITAGLAWLVYRLPPNLPGDDLAFALHLPAMLLLSPLTWWHANILLFLALVWLLKNQGFQKNRAGLMLLLVAFLLLSLPDIDLANFVMNSTAPYRPPWYVGLLMWGNTLGISIVYGMQVSQAAALIREAE
ncbi:MAG: glycosyltransferase family 87 protein [Chloroflexota bacterium]